MFSKARGHTHRLILKSGLPPIYFMFPSSVHFWTLYLGIAGVYSVSKISDFFFCHPQNALNLDQYKILLFGKELTTVDNKTIDLTKDQRPALAGDK